MKIQKLVATTLLTIAATGITAATAYGQAEVSGPAISGFDRGVGYTATVAPDRSSAAMTLTSGTFFSTPEAVTVLAPDGAVVATVPTTLHTITGQELRVAPKIDAAATTLTVTPVAAAAQGAPQFVGAPQFIGNPGTIAAGAAIGCVLGALVGLVLAFIGFVAGCLIGGLIGGIDGANR
ncbi:hypothetical protein ACL02S_03025 [Nocardia sp. 004]|uniref:hypothetical protein n=1 Tax=Nocardia sp. 004 TaxID=3385978 RepID=UPI00399EEEE3